MAYGARLESELGESPQGFKSPILRAKEHPRLSGVFLCTGSRDLEELATVPLSSAVKRSAPKGAFCLYSNDAVI